MAKLPSFGNIEHSAWRMPKTTNVYLATQENHFLDGDLLERFLDLDENGKKDIIEGKLGNLPIPFSVEELAHLLEELARAH